MYSDRVSSTEEGGLMPDIDRKQLTINSRDVKNINIVSNNS